MRNEKETLLRKNLGYMVFYHMFVAVMPLVITPYISRVLGPSEIGKYTYAYSIAYYFVMVANLGISAHGSRMIAEVKHDPEKLDETFSDLFWLHILFSGAVTIIYILAVISGLNRENSTLSYIMIFYVLSSVIDVKWLFYGLEKFRITVLRNVLIRIVYVLLIFCFVKTQDDINLYAFIMAFVAFFLCELSLFILIFRNVKIRKPRLTGMSIQFFPLVLLFIPSVANLLLRHFDKIMIGMMSSYDQLGFYENTDRILVILSLLTTAVGDVMLPRLSSLIATENDNYAKKLFSLVLSISTIISCALTFGVMAVSEEFVPIFFGEEFSDCIALLTWIAPSLIMLNLSVSIRKQYLIPRHMEKVYITATVSSLLINITANAIFIPKYGALGAVYGTLIAEFSVVLIQFIMIHKQISYSRVFGDIIKYSIIGLVMYSCVRIVARCLAAGVAGLLIEILTGITVYCLLTLVMMLLSKDELLNYARRVIRGKFF